MLFFGQAAALFLGERRASPSSGMGDATTTGGATTCDGGGGAITRRLSVLIFATSSNDIGCERCDKPEGLFGVGRGRRMMQLPIELIAKKCREKARAQHNERQSAAF